MKRELRDTQKLLTSLNDNIKVLTDALKRHSSFSRSNNDDHGSSSGRNDYRGRDNSREDNNDRSQGNYYNRRVRPDRYVPYNNSRGGNYRGRGGANRVQSSNQPPESTPGVVPSHPNQISKSNVPATVTSTPQTSSGNAVDPGNVAYAVSENYILVHRDALIQSNGDPATISEVDNTSAGAIASNNEADNAKSVGAGGSSDAQLLSQRTRGAKKA